MTGRDDDETRDAPTKRVEPATERADADIGNDDTLDAARVRPPSLTQLAKSSEDGGAPRSRHNSQIDLYAGEKLGERYVVRGLLGRGGMGAVYHVHDETLDEDVALKAVRSSIATSVGLRDEVRIAQKVTHQNVCRTYDLEDIGGRHFVKMEYVPGETLAERIEAGQLPVTTVVRIARGVAAGLAAAHARGIVHRDLKPGNVMLDGERTVLMDFGLAQYATRSEGDRSGTPGYMSPEQLAGTPVDQRSDLFALGCLIHEMLTGERAFGTGSMTEIEVRQAATDAPDVRAKRPDTPPWLARATALLLARERERRPEGRALLLRGPPPSKRPLIVAAVGAVAIGAGAAWWLLRDATPWRAHIEIVERPGAGHEMSRASIAPDGSSFVFIANYGDQRAVYSRPLREPSTPPRTPTWLFDVPDEADQVRHLRDGSGLLLAGYEQGKPRLMTRDHAGKLTVLGEAFDADDCGDSVVALATERRADFWTWKLISIPKRGGATRVLFQTDGAKLDHPRCDSTGTRVVFSLHAEPAAPNVYVLDMLPGSVPKQLVAGRTPTWGRGDRSIVLSDNGQLVELELASSRKARITTSEGPHLAPEISPDGQTLLFSREEPTHSIYVGSGARSGTRVPTDGTNLVPFVVLLTPDRSTAIAVRRDPSGAHAILAISVRTGAQRTLARGIKPILSHDGRQVFFVSSDRPTEVRAVPIEGGESRLIVEIPRDPVVDGYAGPEALHLALETHDHNGRPTGERGVRIPYGSTQVIDEGDGLMLPPPSGPWRARVAPDRIQFSTGDGKRSHSLRCFGFVTWVDDHRVGCPTNNGLHLLDLDTKQVETTELPWIPRVVMFAADGKHWIGIRDTETVTRLRIDNFGARPLAP